MFRSVFLRRLAILAVFVTLAIPCWAAAASADTQSREVVSTDLLNRLWGWLTGVWAEVGCGIDPNGSCIPGAGHGDVGCGIDPGGCSEPAVQADVGCSIDPDGSPCRG